MEKLEPSKPKLKMVPRATLPRCRDVSPERRPGDTRRGWARAEVGEGLSCPQAVGGTRPPQPAL